MDTIKMVNQGIVFLLELCMLASFAYWGFHNNDSWAAWFLGIGTPVLAAYIWSIFGAPRSSRRLRKPYRIVFAIVMMGASDYLLYRAGQPVYAAILFIIALIAETVAYMTE